MGTTLWTPVPPADEGWYWWRFADNMKPEVVQYGIPCGLPACVDREHYAMWRVGVDDGQEIYGEWGPRVHFPQPLSEFASDADVMAAILAAPVMVFWTCDECSSSKITWKHGAGTSQATCQKCGKRSHVFTHAFHGLSCEKHQWVLTDDDNPEERVARCTVCGAEDSQDVLLLPRESQ